MSTLSRSLKNIFGKKARTIVVVVIIGFSLGVFMSMSITSANITDSASTLSEMMERTATVRAAGEAGFFSTTAMPESILPSIGTVKNVESVQMMLVERIEGEGTDASGRPSRMLVQGMNPGEELMLMNGGGFQIIEGRSLEASDNSSKVAIIGTQLAESNNAYVGDHITLGDTQFKVVGILSSGTRFGDNAAIVPYQVAKSAFDSDGPSVVYVTAESIGDVEQMVTDLRSALGSDYDVVTPTDRSNTQQEALDSIQSNSTTAAWLALITGMAVMVFIMVLITRERIREIGVLKAIGFKNSKIVSQLVTESVALATMGFVVAMAFVLIAGPSISSMMLETGTVDDQSTTGEGSLVLGQTRPTGSTVGFAEVDFTMEPALLAITLVVAVVLGVIGSLYPVMQAIRLRPAEALRYE
jgi:putative ABC transport system permease protein